MSLPIRIRHRIGEAVRSRQAIKAVRASALAELADGRDSQFTEIVTRFGRKSADPKVRRWVDRLEGRRRALLASSEEIVLLGTDGTTTTTTAAEVCARTSRDAVNCLFLLDLVVTTRPSVCIELGTSIGISGSYLAAGLDVAGGGRLITLDRQVHVSDIARRDLAALGLDNVDVVVCVFEHELGRIAEENGPVDFVFLDGNHHEEPTMLYFGLLLPHLRPGAVVAFDDIGWNDGMKRAWARVQQHPAVAASVTVGGLGLVRIAGGPA